MSPLKQGLYRLQAGGAAANHGHPLFLPGGRHLAQSKLRLAAQQGSDGALRCLVDHQPVGTHAAPQAGAHRVRLAQSVFPRHLRIGVEGPGHGHHIRPAVCQDPLRVGYVHDARHGGDLHRLRQQLTDLAGVIHVGHVGITVGADPIVHVFEFAPDPGGDVDHVDLVLQQLQVFFGLLQVHAALDHLVSGDPELDDEILSTGGPDAVEDLHGKAGAVLQAAAVGIRALVEIG